MWSWIDDAKTCGNVKKVKIICDEDFYYFAEKDTIEDILRYAWEREFKDIKIKAL